MISMLKGDSGLRLGLVCARLIPKVFQHCMEETL
jgi:hypothetical protein